MDARRLWRVSATLTDAFAQFSTREVSGSVVDDAAEEVRR
jgi:hypothetical protein